MYDKLHRLLTVILIAAVFLSIGIHELSGLSRLSRLNENTIGSGLFRRQMISGKMAAYIEDKEKPGEDLGIYWLETEFGEIELPASYTAESFRKLKKPWIRKQDWKFYINSCREIWDDLKYFPIPEPSNDVKAAVNFQDSWMYERSYGGKRGHEGTDIMADENIRGYYPVVSMTDGIVLHKGWLEQGGYRIGITAPGGAYFYYAHLDSYADLEIGDAVRAGDLIGFMGDTGYSKTEGTKGKFPVHLHVGIYLTDRGEEISVNPYPVLKYLESRKVKCAYERG